MGVEDGTVRKTVVRPSIVTFPISLRVSEVLSLLCSSTPLSHPTSPPQNARPQLGVGGWPLGIWATKSCVVLIHGRHRQTDRQTTYRPICNRNTALCSASRDKNRLRFAWRRRRRSGPDWNSKPEMVNLL